MSKIILENITKRWGKFYAVDNLNMVIDDNSFITLLGPSGCGKTTTLRMIAGLETPTSGRIIIGDKVVFDSNAGINIPANKRKVGFLFQNYALWPNMTVYKNISFGLSNVKEEMPKYDFILKNNSRLIEILKKPDKIIELIEECKNKDMQVDKEKAHLKFIDYYIISIYTAKKLFSYMLHEKNDLRNEADMIISNLNTENEKLISKYKAGGKTVDGEFVICENGKQIMEKRKLSNEEIDLSVRRVARIVKIGMFMDRYPAELSGGQQQRVAIARTLAPEPSVLFMDEPLSNLDAKLRLEMRYELQRLHVETGSTFVYVTHDQMEAMTLATKICLINNGILQQYEAPLKIYSRPNNLFVADFVGNPSINFIEAEGSQENGEFVFSIFEGKKVRFLPQENLDYQQWLLDLKSEKDESDALRVKLQSEKGYVEKANKDEYFKYNISKVNELDYTLEEEPVLTDDDFVLAVRPEFISIVNNSDLDAAVYGAMPTGMESTLKLSHDNYLLTSVVFGSNEFKIGSKINISIEGSEILLYHRKSGKLICNGSVVI